MNIEEHIKTQSKLPASRRLILSVLVSANSMNEKVTEALKPFDISIQQFNVLRILRGQKGKPANLGTIQERMVSKMSNTTRLVDKLIAKGLTKRVICPENRRKVEISITPEGLEFLEQVDPVVASVEAEITSAFSEAQMNQLSEELSKLRK